ncbi:hypothetical protein M3689_00445 [Alkalihalophilus marmarensis]|jgi:hypothetical protein|uniref:Uncharacterized protein n=1 Tax=Alkalihalophilus marmarensis DSM 21297 TaxID=1188261 RepID=U6SLD7_9BACI|nr:hypothetical protein [Alkalihalophilus marmarensis]ERN52539.1 hypothetical protein A33I_16085 [Alkalihalophilus marmarensis DSM 21297]MCM3487768.1 hypothetical protein [Alkalihalophilus marmarensis]
MKEHKLSNSLYDEKGVNAVHDQVMNAYYAGTTETPKANTGENDQQQEDFEDGQLT